MPRAIRRTQWSDSCSPCRALDPSWRGFRSELLRSVSFRRRTHGCETKREPPPRLQRNCQPRRDRVPGAAARLPRRARSRRAHGHEPKNGSCRFGLGYGELRAGSSRSRPDRASGVRPGRAATRTPSRRCSGQAGGLCLQDVSGCGRLAWAVMRPRRPSPENVRKRLYLALFAELR